MISIALFFSAFLIIMFGILGFVIGWIAHEYFMVAMERDDYVIPGDHPEMYDENGNYIQSELYSVRFEEEDEED